MTPDEFLTYLRSLVDDHGSQTLLAHHLGVTPQYISAVFRRKQDPGPRMLAKLKLKKVVTYERQR